MKLFTKITKTISVAAILGLLATSAIAGNGYGDGTGDAPQDGTGNGPGDCTTGVTSNVENTLLLVLGHNGKASGDQDGSKDQDRDGSCLTRNGAGTGDQDGTKDQDRDRSCVS